MHPYLLNVEGVAVLLNTSLNGARGWAHDGDIPGVRVGKQWRFWAPAVLEQVLGAEAARLALPALPEGHQDPGVVTVPALADLLGLPSRTVSILLRQGSIPGGKVGGQWRAYWPLITAKIASGKPLTDKADGDPEETDDSVDQVDPA